MSLSKKNLDKLNKLKKTKNLNNESKNINNFTNITNNDNLITNPLNLEDPNKIFYSLKSIRNQEAAERAKVSAPPGYSEHSTGFAIDIGDATQRETDFETDFENTDAFRWLIKNAAKFHFKLSFNKDNKYIDYEPWHWRYEGSIEALKVFESANRKL